MNVPKIVAGETASGALERARRDHGPAIDAMMIETARDLLPAGSLLVEMCEYHLSTGGKRLRALIPILAAETLDLDPVRVRPFGAACEMLHNATLVHDDLQDGDTHRRGRETVWKRWSPAQAINLGDAMFYFAVALAQRVESPPEIRRAIVDRILRQTVLVIDGQAREFALKDDPSPALDRYFQVVEGKTSGLFDVPLGGTALLADVPRDLSEAIATAARHLGVLFQIQDDVLDLYGEKGRERRGSDVAEGKMSVLAIHALSSSPPAIAARLRAILAKPREETTDADIAEAGGIFRAAGSLAFALSEIDRRVDAVRNGADLGKSPRLHRLLLGLAEALLDPIGSIRV